jgi:SanA protein
MHMTSKNKSGRKKLFLAAGGLLCAIAAFIFATNLWVLFSGSFDKPEDVPNAQVALILGAKVYNDGRLSHMMQDRADSGLELYKAGKVQKILMSGDHGTKTYDEVNTVKDYLLERGVAPEDLFLDHAGFDTYDSLYRARDIFGVRSLVVVTQKFHLPRAVYIGRSLGLEVYGYAADKRPYQGMFWNETREVFARAKAFLAVSLGIKPKFLGEKIPIEGDSQLSRD